MKVSRRTFRAEPGVSNLDAIIGATGFVGSNLRRQHEFGAMFHSRNVTESAGRAFDTVVCAAAPGSMFMANKFPERDAKTIDAICRSLEQISARRFVLISSIAVLARFDAGDDETTEAFQTELAYGRNRRALEIFCAEHFETCTVVRLPALFGPGLQKNFLFDLLNPVPSMLTEGLRDKARATVDGPVAGLLETIYRWDPDIGMYVVDRAALAESPHRGLLEEALAAAGVSAEGLTNPQSTFQYYDLGRLWWHVERALEAGLGTVHLAPAPLRAGCVYEALLGRAMSDSGARAHHEDFQSRYAEIFGGSGPYIAGEDAVLAGISAFFTAVRRAS